MHGFSFTNGKNASTSHSLEMREANPRTSLGTESPAANSEEDLLETGSTIREATVVQFSSASARRIYLSTVGKSTPANQATEKIPTRSSRSMSLSEMASPGLWHIQPTQPLVETSNPVLIYHGQEMYNESAAPSNKTKHNETLQGSSLVGEALKNEVFPGEMTFIDQRAPLISLEDAQKREKLRRDLSMESMAPMTLSNPAPKSETTPLRSLARRLSVFSHKRPKINWSANQPELPNQPGSGKKPTSKGKKVIGKPTSVRGKNIRVITCAQSCCNGRSDLIPIADAQRQERERRGR